MMLFVTAPEQATKLKDFAPWISGEAATMGPCAWLVRLQNFDWSELSKKAPAPGPEAKESPRAAYFSTSKASLLEIDDFEGTTKQSAVEDHNESVNRKYIAQISFLL
jgi:hypothetical protein